MNLLFAVLVALASFALFSCDSPLDVQANREVIDLRISGKDILTIQPQILDMKYLKYGTKNTITANITNLSNHKLSLTKYYFANKRIGFNVDNKFLKFLEPNGSEHTDLDIEINITPDFFGTIKDTLFINNYYEPNMVINAFVPLIFTDDCSFGTNPADSIYYKSINITNFSTSSAFIKGWSISGDSEFFKLETSVSQPLEISPNFTRQLIVSFKPTANRYYECVFEFDIDFHENNIHNKSKVFGYAE